MMNQVCAFARRQVSFYCHVQSTAQPAFYASASTIQQLFALHAAAAQVLCTKQLTNKEVAQFRQAVEHEYYFQVGEVGFGV
jgi:hypothetical protein